MTDGRDLRTTLGQIDAYIRGLYAPQDEALEAALRESERAGLPEIQVSPNQGKLLQLLVEIQGASKVLEIGTLGGYSTINLARGMPDDGLLISLEIDEDHAEVARENIARAGLSSQVEVRVGDARDILDGLAEQEREAFDLIFIDAEKEDYPGYLERSMRLSRPGTLILADNTIRGGSVMDSEDVSSRAMREFNERLAEDPRLSAIILPILRERIDGLAIARVREV